jgi:dTDP-4-dehydrorhamnose reductase
MNNCLIGYTGFVGSSLTDSQRYVLKINRGNIINLKGGRFDQITCAGLPAQKWKANQEPQKDLENTQNLICALKDVQADKFVLISTIDVYKSTTGITELETNQTPVHAYGKHRLLLEDFVRERFVNHLVLRLPALFGRNLKKNILFDLLNNHEIDKINTDTKFQWYPIKRLPGDIDKLLAIGFNGTINLCTEPVSTKELIDSCFPNLTIPHSDTPGVTYDIHTKFADVFGRTGPYIEDKETILNQLKIFVDQYKK